MEGSKIVRIMRGLHRDIGFLLIGLTLIYGISGILLTYRDSDFLKSEQLVTKIVQSGLSGQDLGRVLHEKVQVVSEDSEMVIFKDGTPENGTYNKATGEMTFMDKTLPVLLDKFNKLHKTGSNGIMHVFTVIYAVLLIFLALSSFFMYKTGSKNLKRGALISIAGIVIAVLML